MADKVEKEKKKFVRGVCRKHGCSATMKIYIDPELPADQVVSHLENLKIQCDGNGRPHWAGTVAASFTFEKEAGGKVIKVFDEEV